MTESGDATTASSAATASERAEFLRPAARAEMTESRALDHDRERGGAHPADVVNGGGADEPRWEIASEYL